MRETEASRCGWAAGYDAIIEKPAKKQKPRREPNAEGLIDFDPGSRARLARGDTRDTNLRYATTRLPGPAVPVAVPA